MGKYKFGDEVLVKVRIINTEAPDYFDYEVKNANNCMPDNIAKSIYIKEKEIISPPDKIAEEVWDTARKIAYDSTDGGMSIDEIINIFQVRTRQGVLRYYTPSEAKSKIDEWEAEKEINVGDVVEHNKQFGVVTNSDYEKQIFTVLLNSGESNIYHKSTLKKTNRQIDIEGLLKRIGGDE